MKEYYTYVYLDPTVRGYYGHFEGIVFEFKPFYVGKGTGNRIEDHIKLGANHYNKHLANKISKIHKQNENVIGIILFTSNNEEKCLNYEKKLIRLWGRKDNNTGFLCNKTDGGDGVKNRIISKEERERISRDHRGRKHTEESRRRMSESKMGKSCGNLTNEHKDKIRSGMATSELWKKRNEKMKGISTGPVSEETKLKISQSLTGHKVLNSTREIWSKQRTGKLRQKTHKNYQVWDINGVEMTTKEAMDFLGLSHYRKLGQLYTSRYPNKTEN